jgi:hypothetical protein
MALPTHVTVTAPAGRRTPVDAADGVEPGGGPLFVTSERVRRVRFSHTTLRSINRGDLVLCNMDGAGVASAELAAAPDEIDPGGRPVKAKAEAPKGAK